MFSKCHMKISSQAKVTAAKQRNWFFTCTEKYTKMIFKITAER